jgi:hypothetical protein
MIADVYIIFDGATGEPLLARVIDRRVNVPRHLRVRRLDLDDLDDLESIPELQVCDGAVTSLVSPDAFRRAAARALTRKVKRCA